MLKIVFGLVQVNQFQTMEAERTWDCVKKPCLQVIVTKDSAPNDNFLIRFGFIPSSPHFSQQFVAEKGLISTHFAQNFTLFGVGGGGSLSFTNISGKVSTILTSDRCI